MEVVLEIKSHHQTAAGSLETYGILVVSRKAYPNCSPVGFFQDYDVFGKAA